MKQLDQMRRALEARRDSSATTARVHPDPTTRLEAAARAGAYTLALDELAAACSAIDAQSSHEHSRCEVYRFYYDTQLRTVHERASDIAEQYCEIPGARRGYT